MHFSTLILPAVLLSELAYGAVLDTRHNKKKPEEGFKCEGLEEGYKCHTDISRSWGPYTPYYSLPSNYKPANIDAECEVTFAQVLSRHAARYPTKGMGNKMKNVIQKIQKNAKSYSDKTKFIKTFKYELEPKYDQLTDFGRREMYNSGIKFFNRYKKLNENDEPYYRVSGQQRVIESGAEFSRGFVDEKAKSKKQKTVSLPHLNVIQEGRSFKNTLDHGTCREFEVGRYSKSHQEALDKYIAVFTPPIVQRLGKEIPGGDINGLDVVHLMGLCPFYTVIDGDKLSQWCGLFTPEEFKQFNYYQTLAKYYKYGDGNPLGAVQGVGFVNELIGRLTRSAVKDSTSTNSTVIGPVDRKIYADFSHDNTMVSIMTAMKLFDGLPKLDMKKMESTDRFNLADIVPFASRVYIEKMKCKSEPDELVRVLVNDRVMKLKCPEKKYGSCTVHEFVRGLKFARRGGNWDQCNA
ncbi:hypothetical protein H072_10614 [Dactylellina haptotyla CBS 200.50]|uniref:Phytase A n=1 Tax=Dactylellina haptotyla (strain CBS 200.50) TaxID=1284197 RepID=S8A494_DACHA|nr:hypothetical protein H072_10614 [Dactylellina haptotyla CBS 200.50]